MSFLLDTNVVTELRKPRPHAAVVRWFDEVPSSALYLSVLVVGEIRQGVERLRRREPARAAGYDAWLEQLRTEFADRILPINEDVAWEWGSLNTGPDPLPVGDSLLAATARVWNLTLVSRNTADFRRMDVPILNPFAG